MIEMSSNFVASLALLITALAGFIKVIRSVRKLDNDVGEVHKIVNSNNDAMVQEQRRLNDRVEQLVLALGEGGIHVPPRPDGTELPD